MHIDPNIRRVLVDGLRREGWNGGQAKARAQAADKGGLTRGGVTAKSWGDYKGLGRLATAAELDAITEEEALAFYFHRYVTVPRFDQVLDQRLRALLIDWAFTSWFDDPTKALQYSLAAQGLYHGEIDGELGPKSLAALQSSRDPRRLFRDVFNARIEFYLRLAFDRQADAFLASHPTSQLANCRGWIRRCLEFTP